MNKNKSTKCNDCDDSGEIEVETVLLTKPYMKNGVLVQDVISDAGWTFIKCHCVGENK